MIHCIVLLLYSSLFTHSVFIHTSAFNLQLLSYVADKMPRAQTLVSLLCTLGNVNIAVSLTLRLCYLAISTYAYPNKEDTHTLGDGNFKQTILLNTNGELFNHSS